MKFRVFNDYDYIVPSPIEPIELGGGHIVPVYENGFKDIEIDYLGDHKNLYLMLANCIDIDEMKESERDMLLPIVGVPSSPELQGMKSKWVDSVNEKLFPIIEQFGNLGCSRIMVEREIVAEHEIKDSSDQIPIYEVEEDVISRRSPSKIADGVYIARPDFFAEWFGLDGIHSSPPLYKALYDLKKMLVDFQQEKEIDLELLNAHLTQCNVISITEQKEINGRYFYRTVPRVDNLLGLAFWQFQQLLLENNPDKIAVCAMCGNYFEKRSHKGRFCNETITGAYGEQLKVNSCTSRYNSLKNRVKKNYVKDASLTIDDLAKKHRCSIELIVEFVEQWEKDGIQRNEL